MSSLFQNQNLQAKSGWVDAKSYSVSSYGAACFFGFYIFIPVTVWETNRSNGKLRRKDTVPASFPGPSVHPGTRQAICQKLLTFIG